MTRRWPWPLLAIAAPAAVAIWSGWVGLGGMCGFGPIHPLPGIWDELTINTAITLPIGVESYGAYALHAWLGRADIGGPAREFARNSAFGALALGCLGQIAYHLLAAAHWAAAPWWITMCVACLPVVTLSLAATLAHMIRGDTAEESAEGIAPEVIPDITTEPAEVSPRVSAAVSARVSDPDIKAAHREYRKSVRDGKPLSQRALAAKFGKSQTWGRDRISEVNSGPASLAAAR